MDTFHALADLVDARYVLADRAGGYAGTIRAHADDLEALLPDVEAVNSFLHDLVPDHHLGLRRTGREPSPPPALRSGGIHRVEHLDAGVCLVEIHPFFGAPDEALPHLRAAATLASGAEALALDLRRCHGGDTDTAALIHGWLLGPGRVRLGHVERRGRPPVDYVTDPRLGRHFPGPVRVLTSGKTFSGGEDLAYVLQALGRARVVGEQTGGGAHPVEHADLPGGWHCQIPVARSVIEATGTNWEGVGVTPDVRCPAASALDVAQHDLAQHDSAPHVSARYDPAASA